MNKISPVHLKMKSVTRVTMQHQTADGVWIVDVSSVSKEPTIIMLLHISANNVQMDKLHPKKEIQMSQHVL